MNAINTIFKAISYIIENTIDESQYEDFLETFEIIEKTIECVKDTKILNAYDNLNTELYSNKGVLDNVMQEMKDLQSACSV